MAVRTIWTGFEANFPAVKGAVGNARNLLVVDVDGNGTALGYHSNEVALAQPLLDGWTVAARQCCSVRSIGYIDSVRPILIHI